MSQSVTVASVRTKIRQLADCETLDEANSVITDAELTSVINDGFRSLYDIIANVAGHESFATSATVTAPTFAVPADFYRALGVDFPNYYGTNQHVTAKRFSFAERNRRVSPFAVEGLELPTYRVQNGALKWEPVAAAPTTSVTLWYVPTPAVLASGGSFDAVNGWDDYVVAWGVRYCREKQEEDSKPALLKLAQAEQRVRANAARIQQDPVSVADIRCIGDGYNS
jgi:hypothetical protein